MDYVGVYIRGGGGGDEVAILFRKMDVCGGGNGALQVMIVH